MQAPLQITFQGMPPSEAVADQIRRRASKLERFFDRITSCHVVVAVPHRHHHHAGVLYSVRVDVGIPGAEIVANRDAGADPGHEDVNVAVRDAFDAALRQLEEHLRRRHGRVKRHETPPTGVVRRLFPREGYGFLESDDGLEVYFHEHAVPRGAFDQFGVGTRVRFTLAEGEGREGPQASTVRALGASRRGE